jgi:hypothetical protein
MTVANACIAAPPSKAASSSSFHRESVGTTTLPDGGGAAPPPMNSPKAYGELPTPIGTVAATSLVSASITDTEAPS